MLIKQLSVFVENTEGSLECVARALCKNNINIASFSLADSSEYGVLRMIVSDPEQGRKILKEEGFSAMLTEVIAVKIAQKPGTIHEVLKILFEAGLSVEYMYTLSTTGRNTSVIMKLSDLETALVTLGKNGYEVCTDREAYEINNFVEK